MDSSAAMRLRLDDTQTGALVRFFRERDFLAVRRARGIVEIVPLIALSESADRRRVVRLLAEWQHANHDAPVELLDDA